MDIVTIDSQCEQLQSQAQATIAELRTLVGKLQAAVQAGNQDAREWLLDLKSVALSIQSSRTRSAYCCRPCMASSPTRPRPCHSRRRPAHGDSRARHPRCRCQDTVSHSRAECWATSSIRALAARSRWVPGSGSATT